MSEHYDRKISSEEAAEGYIMILKDRLSFFPPVGKSFDLREGGANSSAKVEARDCTCRGPEKPHQHYFIRRAGLIKGGRVRVKGDAAGYEIEVIRPSH